MVAITQLPDQQAICCLKAVGMTIQTTRFGEIEVRDECRVTLTEGLLGFEHVTEFCLFAHAPGSPFYWMQAIDDPALAFVVISPFDFFADYDFDLSDADLDRLQIAQPDDVTVLTLVTFNGDDVTVNLLGPIVINHQKQVGRQIVLNDPRYQTRHHLMTLKSDA